MRASTAPTDPRTRMRNLTLLLASTLTVMAGATIAPSLPEMERAFASEPNVALLVKFVVTVPGLFIALGAPLAGMLIDRRQKKPVVVISLVLYGIAGTSGFFVADSLYAILVGRALLGLAVAGLMTGCTTLIAEYFVGPRLGHFIGLQAAVSSFGGVLFLLVGGALASLGWRAPFLIYLFAFCVLPAAARYLYEPDQRLRALTQTPTSEPQAAAALPLLSVLGCYALALFEILCLYMVPVHYPFYANSLEPVGAAQTGWAIATLLLVIAAVATQYRRAAARFSFVTVHALGLMLLGAGFVMLGSIESYLASYVGLVVSGAGLGLMRPNLMVWLLSFTPMTLRGRVLGGVTTFFFLGQFICPLATEPSIAALGLAATFRLVGGVTMALALGFVSVGAARAQRARSAPRASIEA